MTHCTEGYIRMKYPSGVKVLQLLSPVSHNLFLFILWVSNVKAVYKVDKISHHCWNILFLSCMYYNAQLPCYLQYLLYYVSSVAECCQVMFDYKAKAEDELDLKKGDVVVILKKVLYCLFFLHCLVTYFPMTSCSLTDSQSSFGCNFFSCSCRFSILFIQPNQSSHFQGSHVTECTRWFTFV